MLAVVVVVAPEIPVLWFVPGFAELSEHLSKPWLVTVKLFSNLAVYALQSEGSVCW